MIDVIVGLVLAAMVGAAIAYIVKAKKRGVKCVGCPEGASCPSRNNPEGCGCTAAESLEESLDEIRQAVRNGQEKE